MPSAVASSRRCGRNLQCIWHKACAPFKCWVGHRFTRLLIVILLYVERDNVTTKGRTMGHAWQLVWNLPLLFKTYLGFSRARRMHCSGSVIIRCWIKTDAKDNTRNSDNFSEKIPSHFLQHNHRSELGVIWDIC